MRKLPTLLAGCVVGALLTGAAAVQAAPLGGGALGGAGAIGAQSGLGLDQTTQGMTNTTTRPSGATTGVTANSATAASQDTSATVGASTSGAVNPRSANAPPTDDTQASARIRSKTMKGGPVNPRLPSAGASANVTP